MRQLWRLRVLGAKKKGGDGDRGDCGGGDSSDCLIYSIYRVCNLPVRQPVRSGRLARRW
ncbi:hypothetical protein [Eastern grey kangaroopox virus]|uniref:Uncharacterized protein n=1 Tax=Eastern grey kangaroopox virus TaxID=2042482 RepID=A0A2C9DSY5_9POXV|nr:hypothetical protein KM541_gp022 [Eastern grey kangaroopox virus]ATI21118.1 hypothetical protein [Eastern grey kangaroopox virus]AXK50165.1 hypothetical protein EKPV-NSW-ORF034 [Eastern grey kangaroopox virus]